MGASVEILLQNLFGFLILFGLSAILKIYSIEYAHYVQLVATASWNQEKQMFVALGKYFDMNPWTLLGYNFSWSLLFWITKG